MKWFYALVLVLPFSAQAQQSGPASGYSFPQKFGAAELVNVEDFEAKQPGLGQVGQYKFQGWRFSVYVYDKRRTDLPDRPDPNATKAELDASVADILEARKLGHYARADEGAAFAIPPTATPPTFQCRSFVLQPTPRAGTAAQPPYDSFICVATAKKKYFKLRISSTTPTGDQATVFTPVAASIELFGRQILR